MDESKEKKVSGLIRIIQDKNLWTSLVEVAGVIASYVIIVYVASHYPKDNKLARPINPPSNYSLEFPQHLNYPREFQPEPLNPEYFPERPQI